MMLIRSQDKKYLIPLNRPIYASYDNSHTIYVDSGGTEADQILGQYDSDERCIQILDEIQNEAVRYSTIKSGYGPSFMFEHPKCYQMPEK